MIVNDGGFLGKVRRVFPRSDLNAPGTTGTHGLSGWPDGHAPPEGAGESAVSGLIPPRVSSL